ncbi:hypothetical protein [Mesobacterium pallidum]|uniref:hypothetical protein n=1 Tax=Mesobacterium pallidum TaxID=2872037 RepID=UPI001EE23459|nr:hypothetical protein [Mesobacterium pallidum]
MRIAITDFKGAAPKRGARLLPDGYGRTAINSRLSGGELDPVRASAAETTLGAAAQTIYRHGGSWLSWNADVDAAPGHIASDRLYITGDGVPKMYAGGSTYPLALAAPVAAPAVAIDTGTPDEDIAADILFGYTYVTSFGEESPLSPLSTAISWSSGVTLTVNGFTAPPSGREIDTIRIYRSQTSLLGTTDLYLVKEIAWTGGLSYTYDDAVDPLQTLLESADYDTPPDDMAGLIALPNGIMAAFDGKELLFSEPYRPHAWPNKYRLTTDFDIVGLASFGSFLAIMTEGTPYRAQGTHPSNMSMEKIEENLPCLAKKSIVDLGYAAIYSSPEGLVQITSGSASVVSRPLFTMHQWNAADPASIVAARHDGRYFFTHAGKLVDTTGGSAMIDLTGAQPFLVQFETEFLDTFTPPATDGTIYLLLDDGVSIVKWDDFDSADCLEQEWWSKDFITPQMVNFGVLRVDASNNNAGDTFTVQVWADKTKVFEAIGLQNANEYLRLPSGFISSEWHIRVITTMTVQSIVMSETFDEMNRL